MRGYITAFAVAVALVLPAVSFAQGPPGGMEGGPMRRMRESTIEWLLTQKAQFRPTTEQVAKLEEIQKQLTEQTAKQREEMQKLREEARNGNGDRRANFDKVRGIMDEMRKKDEQATKEALDVLNGEQRKVVEELIEQRRKEMEQARSRMRRPGGQP